MSDSVRPYGLQPTRLLCPWDSPGKNTGVGCHFLLQEIFLTQGLTQPALQAASLQSEPLGKHKYLFTETRQQQQKYKYTSFYWASLYGLDRYFLQFEGL